MGDLADKINVDTEIKYEDIQGFPLSTVKSHEGKLIFGTLFGKKVACMQGRIHYYEGYDMWDVVLPIRVCNKLVYYWFNFKYGSGIESKELSDKEVQIISKQYYKICK